MTVCFNGLFCDDDIPLLTAGNSSFKWGDGVFETAKVYNGNLVLGALHFTRLFQSLELLQIERPANFTPEILTEQLLELCLRNSCSQNARIRLAVYRTATNTAGYVIEARPLSPVVNNWQEEGLAIGLYSAAVKSIDMFSGIKSASYLAYILAARYAASQHLDDCLLLNSKNNCCDSSRANLFLVSDHIFYTPALEEGCINGVMRQAVINTIKNLNYEVIETSVSEARLLDADEVFLTNAIQIIRWVKKYKERTYTCQFTQAIFTEVQSTIFSPSC